MFQNIVGENLKEEESKKNNLNILELIKESISVKDIVIYIICFFIGGVTISDGIAPFGIAMFAAICSNSIPIIIPYMLILCGGLIKNANIGLNFLLITVLFTVLIVLFRNKIEFTDKNEQKRLGRYIVIATAVSQMASFLFNSFLIYDLLNSIINIMLVYVFYKIFSNSIDVLRNIRVPRAYSVEEIIGASIVISIASINFGSLSFWGMEIKNIINIFIVLFLGWQNGMLLGAASGITIGAVTGIVAGSSIDIIAAYAISGILAGFFSKFGRLAVIGGFIIGNILLCYTDNGGVYELIHLKEILIASIGLLLFPKNVKLDIVTDEEERLITQGAIRVLNQNNRTISKLNDISEAVSQMASTYDEIKEVNEDLENEEKENLKEQIITNISDLQDNFLYDEILENENIIYDIIEKMSQVKEFSIDDMVEILRNNNNYILGIDDDITKKDIYKIVKRINDVYKANKIKDIWSKRIDENKKSMSSQLSKVSKVISKVADDIKENKQNEEYCEKYSLEIGLATATKNNSKESGDSNLYIKLDDGKYLIAISDGMGSGVKAKKSSNAAIKMLEKLLKAGFDREESIKMINSNLSMNLENMYATLDVTVLDLNKGNMEFIKNGACPTFIKNGKYVQVVKSIGLPTGILNNIDMIILDRDVELNDIIIMCSDGIIESNVEYKNKEMWLKNLIEQIQTDDAKKIANIILQEAIDNGFGINKDDMTVMVAKVVEKDRERK